MGFFPRLRLIICFLSTASEREKGMISQGNYPLENYILEERKAQEQNITLGVVHFVLLMKGTVRTHI